jgi:tRNA pseudouridine38-40 synthase
MVPPSSSRIAFTVHYDGSAFHGWQLQRDHVSVQGELERVFSRLFDRPGRVIGSGRTDRGVHATGQVAAVDAPDRWTAAALRRAANSLLPASIWIESAEAVSPRFHPRFDAVSRTYHYYLGVADRSGSPFHAPWCWPLRRPVRRGLLEAATPGIVGDRSFRAFAKAGQEERGDRCVVTEAVWSDWSDLGVVFRVSANRFLHHMVRYLVGTLVEIATEGRSPEDLRRLLENEPGIQTSPPAPASGLFLTGVRYPPGAYSGVAREAGPDSDVRTEPKRPPS